MYRLKLRQILLQMLLLLVYLKLMLSMVVTARPKAGDTITRVKLEELLESPVLVLRRHLDPSVAVVVAAF